jgi:hypothetical protein
MSDIVNSFCLRRKNILFVKKLAQIGFKTNNQEQNGSVFLFQKAPDFMLFLKRKGFFGDNKKRFRPKIKVKKGRALKIMLHFRPFPRRFPLLTNQISPFLVVVKLPLIFKEWGFSVKPPWQNVPEQKH